MSLNLEQWSYVIFAVQLFFYMIMALISLGTNNRFSLVLMFISFILLQGTTVAYGIFTGQPGFIFSVIVQFILIFITFIVSLRINNEDK
jgi:lipoprotein signal peptidase